MKKYRIFLLFLTIILFAPFNLEAKNYDLKAKAESSDYLPGDEVKVEISLNSAFPGIPLEGFECSLSYNHPEFKLKKILSFEPISRNQLKTEIKENFINIKYNPKKLKKISSESSEIILYEIYLKTYKKSIPKTINLHAEFSDCNSHQKIASNDFSINIVENPEIQNCRLRSIRPNIGSLSPEFSPNNFNYSMDVPADTKYLDFEFIPLNEDLDVKINRRKLNAAGKTTYFKITVSNKNLKIKKVYEIEVFRGAADKKSSKKSKSKEKANDKSNEKPKTNSSKSKKNNKNSLPYSLPYSENLDEDDYCEGNVENIESDDSNNNSKIYLIVSISIVSLGFISYVLYELVKHRKKVNKNTPTPINKN